MATSFCVSGLLSAWFGTEASYSSTLVPAGQFRSICSCWPRLYPHIFRYRSTNVRKIVHEKSHLPENPCFQGTRMCLNQASVPNSLPSLYMIDRFTSFRPASMDEILLKTAFCTENQCPGMPEQCPNVPGHARTMPEAPLHVPGRARTCQNHARTRFKRPLG